jgi:hypothetical protein
MEESPLIRSGRTMHIPIYRGLELKSLDSSKIDEQWARTILVHEFLEYPYSLHVAHPRFALTHAVPSSSILCACAASLNVVTERVATNGIGGIHDGSVAHIRGAA